MTLQAQKLLEEALALSETDRAKIVTSLLDSLCAEGDSEAAVQAAWRVEIERRVYELDTGAVVKIPWADVKRDLLGGTSPDDH